MPVFESFMTGVNAGNQQADRRTRQQTGSLMASGDYAGAARTAYQGGDLATGQAVTAIGQTEQRNARFAQMAPLIQQGNWEGAMQVATTPEEFAQLRQWRTQATADERALASEKASTLASIGATLANIPVEQRFAEAQRIAPTFGMDPGQITPDMLTDQSIRAWTIQALGMEGWLKQQDRERDATRPIVTPFGIMMPPGSPAPAGMPAAPGSAPQGEVLGDLPPGASIRPRPNQAPVRAGAERNQTPTVSFGSTGQAQAAIRQAIPGVTFTSGTRSAAHNRRVGGVPNSYHVKGRAWDLTPPRGMTMAQLEAKARSLGLRVLNEGDHVHVSW